MTVDLEVGYIKIGDADEPDLLLPEDTNAILEGLEFPPLGPIPVMALHHQIAQKLHAVSAPGGMRVHDLIDLRLLAVFRLAVGSPESFRLRFMTHWLTVLELKPNSLQHSKIGLPVEMM